MMMVVIGFLLGYRGFSNFVTKHRRVVPRQRKLGIRRELCNDSQRFVAVAWLVVIAENVGLAVFD
jgi:hypothetical protein